MSPSTPSGLLENNRKMILWQSLHIEVYRDSHGQASASGDDDQHELLPGSWMISRWVPRRMRRPPMIVYPIPVGLFSARGRSPKGDRCRRHRLRCEGKRRAPPSAARLGRTFLLGC